MYTYNIIYLIKLHIYSVHLNIMFIVLSDKHKFLLCRRLQDLSAFFAPPPLSKFDHINCF